jgi:hypothetical protein
VHGCRIASGPLRTEVSRCVAGEESWSELANTPAKPASNVFIHRGLLTGDNCDPRQGRGNLCACLRFESIDCFVAALLAMTCPETSK